MCPVVLTRGQDQSPISTRFEQRGDPSVMRNYGSMLVELSRTIPDGIICFFVSYSYMDLIVSKWNDMGILQVLAEPALPVACWGTGISQRLALLCCISGVQGCWLPADGGQHRGHARLAVDRGFCLDAATCLCPPAAVGLPAQPQVGHPGSGCRA